MKKKVNPPGGPGHGERASGGSNSVSAIVRPLVTVDIAIFSVRDKALSVLLVQRGAGPDEPFPLQWALPGGFVDVQKDATIEACARRKLADKTGVTTPYLEQLGSWGSAKRDPRDWSVTNVYFALIASDKSCQGDGLAPQQAAAGRGGMGPWPEYTIIPSGFYKYPATGGARVGLIGRGS